MTPLLYAAQEGNAAAVVVLLKVGAYVDWQDGSGATALILASMSGHAMAAEALLAKGAAIDIQDGNGWTALVSDWPSVPVIPPSTAPTDSSNPALVLADVRDFGRVRDSRGCASGGRR